MTIVEQVLSVIATTVHATGDLFADVMIHVLILLYAPYCSIKAVRSVDTEDDTKWLSFWCCYALISFVDEFSFMENYLPMYRLVKLGILVWLLFGGGSMFIFKRLVDPFMVKYETVIDDAIARMDQQYRQKYFADDKGLEQLLKDKQEFVQKNGAKLYNSYLKICLEKHRAKSDRNQKFD